MNLDTQSLQPIINFIWAVADDVLINKYLENQYQDVILPMTVLRRLDLALEPTKNKVLKTHNEFKSKMDNLTGILTSKDHGSGLEFYNTSPYTMKMLLEDPNNIDANFLDYLNGFSENVQDIIQKFKFRNQLDTFESTGITFSLLEKFCSPKVELSPEKISPMAMGYMFEDLIRRFNEKTNAAAGRHFTPREIIELMTHLVYLPVKDKIQKGTYLVYDPCAGSGAMLTQSKKYATNPEGEIKSKASFHLYGQENTGEMYAVCKSDMLLKGEDPDKIQFGSTLSKYGFDPNLKFNFMLTNPPYGTSWKEDQKELNEGTGKKIEIKDTRFNLKIKNFKGELEKKCLTSRSNDGQLMFMLHMLSKMKAPKDGGSRIASVHNGSALFTGDAGSGESGIRQYILENDLLECIIQLPNDMFYNTGIATYIWILSNNKSEERKGKVQLINASSKEFYTKMRKGLGDKKVELAPKQIIDIQNIYFDFEENEYSKIFNNEDFGFYQITTHQPEKDEKGNIITDKKGNPKPDKNLKDSENVPMAENIDDYFAREVLPFAENAWYDKKKMKVGYEIPFNKYFYEFKSLRPLVDISNAILALENETEHLLKEIVD
ncbi:HsdM family class I SAM-dependent methyltransferase [Tenacibaculum maritimum]|uniref:class I SAM-dependent DNA methyltransferase n=1 Tax=Tenacibaculum maritimum TaxID=107401 RepID=UPI001E2DFDE3|nr:class I SAM-dependent DNA methyltransferase [Tenacibaculum maritimum]MCD9563403.1 type I restriction-modification system subunit M [Tenacibaculum maritimum]MCD9566971.1 type I restriction-modification system subunit M [Tenacibaculum maritimum]MCD9579644.1 type I restriction-modification system subunit M [Tenacibaculum maritimum]MCD9597022.1 type I restriction-modification system subunit M [Tenacibaculum maritimum]MCD9614092.1 type I restriction-modification system subunit M [Tenacibaculum m